MKKVILITGCSSGMGLEAALLLAAKGHKVYASLRSIKSEQKVQERAQKEGVSLNCLELDVTKEKSVRKAVEKIVKKEGRIDVLLNNAGFGVVGALETLSEKDLEKQFDVNYYGYVRCIHAVLPQMRKQKSGAIINVSSVAGVAGFAYWSAYVSTKFAIEGMSECLKAEVEPFGIKVKLIEPGPVATNFDKDMIMGTRKLVENPYAETMKQSLDGLTAMLKTGQSAKEAALQAYVKAVEDTSGQFRFQTNEQAVQMAARKLKDTKSYIGLF